MRLHQESELWSTGEPVERPPLVAALEVSGAVMSWTVDAATPPTITFLNHDRADWLWRVVGEAGHVSLVEAMREPVTSAAQRDIDDVEIAASTLEVPRRIAFGHWMRRWWPTSVRDGIAALDAALLDAEIAVLTAEAQHFFSDDTIDSDVAGLVAPHAGAFGRLIRVGDPRISEVVTRAIELADEAGVGDGPDASLWQGLYALLDGPGLEMSVGDGHQDDYALAAGDSGGPEVGVIARGEATIHWGSVPPGIFDAAENTAQWVVPSGTGRTTAVVRTALIGGMPSGIAVTLRSGHMAGAGALDERGSAEIDLGSGGAEPSESELWGHDWSATEVIVGVPVAESTAARDRVRAFVRGRLAEPPADAFLAEIVAGESDY